MTNTCSRLQGCGVRVLVVQSHIDHILRAGNGAEIHLCTHVYMCTLTTYRGMQICKEIPLLTLLICFRGRTNKCELRPRPVCMFRRYIYIYTRMHAYIRMHVSYQQLPGISRRGAS